MDHTWNGLISRATTGPVCLLNLWTSESAAEIIFAGSQIYSSPCSEPPINKPDVALPWSMPYEPHTSLWNLPASNIDHINSTMNPTQVCEIYKHQTLTTTQLWTLHQFVKSTSIKHWPQLNYEPHTSLWNLQASDIDHNSTMNPTQVCEIYKHQTLTTTQLWTPHQFVKSTSIKHWPHLNYEPHTSLWNLPARGPAFSDKIVLLIRILCYHSQVLIWWEIDINA